MTEGSTLVARLEEKYLDTEDLLPDAIVLTITGSSPWQMASIQGLELIVLNHMDISHVGDTKKLADLVKHVWEMDIGWNSLEDWQNIHELLLSIPHLKTLNLSHNPLYKQPLTISLPPSRFLRTLILNGTQLSLETLRSLLKDMECLGELHLSDNDFSHLVLPSTSDAPMSTSVQTVHLNRCSLSDWSHIEMLLGLFPQVKKAFLSENPIKRLHASTRIQVNHLNLGKTELNDWASIDALDTITSLTELRIPSIPLFEHYKDNERDHLVIARIRNLQVYNGSQVTEEQRETSERFFIRYYQEQEEKPAQLKRLIDKHGPLEKLPKIDLTPKEFASVNIVCEEKDYKAKLKINLKKNVGQLMKYLEKSSGISYSRMRLFHQREIDGWVDECRYHNMHLYSIGVDDGDTIFIQSKMVTTRRRGPPKKCS